MKRLLFSLLTVILIASEVSAKNTLTEDIGEFLTPAGGLFLGLTGIKSKHPFRERMAVTITSLAIDEILVQSLKHTIHSKRPDGSDNKSFPSGHTSIAFCGAEIMREEYGWWWGAGAYAFSVGIGALRICHHKHRFVDVLGGAVIGIGSARLGYLLLPLERKWFKWDQTDKTLAIVPSISKEFTGCSVNLIF